MTELEEFIRITKDARELKRALAVHNTLAGRPWAEAASELGVKESFIGTWRWRYKRDGIACLSVGHRGSQGYLNPTDTAAVIDWIQEQDRWDIRTLSCHIDRTYGVRYTSRQSYSVLLKAARMSWKKSQHAHPDADPKQVTAKRAEINKNAGGSPGDHSETDG